MIKHVYLSGGRRYYCSNTFVYKGVITFISEFLDEEIANKHYYKILEQEKNEILDIYFTIDNDAIIVENIHVGMVLRNHTIEFSFALFEI